MVILVYLYSDLNNLALEILDVCGPGIWSSKLLFLEWIVNYMGGWLIIFEMIGNIWKLRFQVI